MLNFLIKNNLRRRNKLINKLNNISKKNPPVYMPHLIKKKIKIKNKRNLFNVVRLIGEIDNKALLILK